MGLLLFFSKLFKIRRSWNGSPEMFLALVMEMQARNNKKYSAREVLQWGEVMQKMVKVDLRPYKDFTELMARGIPDFSMVEKLRKKMDGLNQRVELKKAIYGDRADLGEDDVMKSNAEGAVFARKFVKDMFEYVNFPDEDQDTADKL